MIQFDGIIYSLQSMGGVSVLFNELIGRFQSGGVRYRLDLFDNNHFSLPHTKAYFNKGRLFERYRHCPSHSDAKIFHSTYYRVPTGRSASVVTTVHDFVYERFLSGPSKFVHSWQKNKAIRDADAVICVSESTKRDLLEFLPDIPEDRVRVIYNGVSDDFHPLCTVDKNYGSPYIIYVGSRAKYKNFEVAVNAIALLKDINLICIGGGPLNENEEKLIHSHLSGRFRHLGNVTNQQLNVLYNSAFCMLYPSIYEGFGIPVLEAMQAGCPVIAMKTSSIPEVAGNSAILLEEASSELIASAVMSLSTGEIREALRSSGFVQAENFSWDKTYVATFNLYCEISGMQLGDFLSNEN